MKFSNAIKNTPVEEALRFIDPLDSHDVLALIACVDEDHDLSSLDVSTFSNSLLFSRIQVDRNPEYIDQEFDKGVYELLEDLIRMGIDWEHSNFQEFPEELVDWLYCSTQRIALLRCDTNELDGDVEGALRCALEPEAFSMALSRGDESLDFLDDEKLFGDVLVRFGGSSWSLTLAILEKGSDAFKLASETALFSSYAVETASNSNDTYERIARGEEEIDTAFDLIFATYEDGETAAYVQAAAVEILQRRGVSYPRIDGAPFSGTEYDAWDIEEARRILGKAPANASEEVRRARLLSDLFSNDFPEKSELNFERFHNFFPKAFLEFETLKLEARKDSLKGLAAIDILLERNWNDELVKTLTELVAEISLFHVDYLRDQIANFYLS